MANEVTVHLKGPIFSRLPKELADKAANDVVRTLVEDGTKHLAEVLRPRPGGVYLSVAEAGKGKASTGNYRRNIQPIIEGPKGRINDNSVIYGAWLEGVGSRNERSRFKGYAAYRKTADWMNERADKVAQQVAEKIAKDLNG